MGITGSIIVYVMIWWIIFFSVLPIGIQSNKEVTTLITTVIFSVIYYLAKAELLNLREFLQ